MLPTSKHTSWFRKIPQCVRSSYMRRKSPPFLLYINERLLYATPFFPHTPPNECCQS